MAWESGKSQIIKFIALIIVIFGIIAFMLVSFVIVPYKDIETYLMMNIMVDAILIISMIFCINLRVWRKLSGATFYALETYSPAGTVDTELYKRESYFEVDINKMEDFMDDRQIRILRENESAIADLKKSVEKMNYKQTKSEKEARKKAAEETEKTQKELEKRAAAEKKAKEKAAKKELSVVELGEPEIVEPETSESPDSREIEVEKDE